MAVSGKRSLRPENISCSLYTGRVLASLYFLASLKIESVDRKVAVEVAKDDFLTGAATVIDVIERIDQLYSDPINNIIPVAEVFSMATRAFDGSLKESTDKVFKDLREGYRKF